MRQRRRIPVPLAVAVMVVAVACIVSLGIWGALQPRVANHFGYALPGRDGLPAYIYANGRRYQSQQVCAGADWCAPSVQNRRQQLIPRCYTGYNLRALQIWPLARFGTMPTLFGMPHPILAPTRQGGLTRPLVVADGPNCYVIYSLEGGP